MKPIVKTSKFRTSTHRKRLRNGNQIRNDINFWSLDDFTIKWAKPYVSNSGRNISNIANVQKINRVKRNSHQLKSNLSQWTDESECLLDDLEVNVSLLTSSWHHVTAHSINNRKGIGRMKVNKSLLVGYWFISSCCDLSRHGNSKPPLELLKNEGN